MDENARLSKERLLLIRRFMGEEVADEGQSEDPISVELLARTAAAAEPRSQAVAQRIRAARSSAPVRLWHRLELRWPLATIVLSVGIGVLIGRGI